MLKCQYNGSLPSWGNNETMNLNPILLRNIQASVYYENTLMGLNEMEEVIDQIYYSVRHLEPWERGTRCSVKLKGASSQIRGVSKGGMASTAFCILYKIHCLKPNHNQIYRLLNHKDSAYIRAIGFMYLRFTQPPSHIWNWFQKYLDDQEPLVVQAGGKATITIGHMIKIFLTHQNWFDTFFPRFPVPWQRKIQGYLAERLGANTIENQGESSETIQMICKRKRSEK